MIRTKHQPVDLKLPLILGVLLFGLIVWATELLIQSQQRASEMSRSINLQTDLYSIRGKVDRSLQSVLHLSIGMTAYIEAKAGIVEEQEVMDLMGSLFDHSHSDLIKSFSLIEDTTIRFVYPESGNEASLGVDLREVTVQWPDVLTAMNSAEGVLAGPTEMLQGGQAMVFRMPVRVNDSYWGMFNTVIDMDAFMAEIATSREFSAADVAIKTTAGFLLGNGSVLDDPQVQQLEVSVPGGAWQLAAVPNSRVEDFYTIAWRLLGWVMAFLMGAALTTILMQRGALQGLVLIDELTGVANRRQFNLMLEKFCQKYHRRDTGGFALLFVDLDRFKAINDNHGHKAGDYFLVEIARRISLAIRGGDLLARWGGDEFVIIVENPTDTSVNLVVNRVRDLAEQAVMWRNQQLQVGASIGVVRYPDDGITPDALLGTADQKMYENKRARRLED